MFQSVLRRRSTVTAAVALLAAAQYAQAAAIMLCWDATSANPPFDPINGRAWAVVRADDVSCDDFGGGGAINARCYDLYSSAVPAPLVVHDTHPAVDGAGVIGNVGDITLAARADGSTVAFYVSEGIVVAAELPNGLELGEAGALMSGSMPAGLEIPFPPLQEFEGQHTGVFAQGDFSMYFYGLDLQTNQILAQSVASVNLADLNFQPLPVPCYADVNNDGILNSQDFYTFLAAFFMDDPAADFNRDGLITSQDFFDYIVVFVAGC